MNNNSYATQIAQAILPIFKDRIVLSNKKFLNYNFQQTEQYADSFISFEREGTGIFKWGAPPPDSKVKELQVAITMKPGVLEPGWVGFNVFIINPEDNPEFSIQQKWLENGGFVEASNEEIERIIPHITRLISTPVLPEGEKPIRESPPEMYLG